MSNTDLSHLDGAQRIAEERAQQIAGGYSRDHDGEHDDGSLLAAAHAYLTVAKYPSMVYSAGGGRVPASWPWEPESWKPSHDPIHNLEKAGALIAAEIDRRAAASGETT